MTRFPHGFTVNEELLARIKEAESKILKIGFWLTRIRHGGKEIRVEVVRNELERAQSAKDKIVKILKEMLNRDIMKVSIEVYEAENQDEGSQKQKNVS